VPDITVHPASLGYSGLLRMAAGELGFYAALSANIPGGNDGTDQDFKNSRYGATASYRILRFGANYVHAFRNEWQARAVFNAQYSNDALVSGEQFGVGGPDSVRGYLLREAASDRGYAGQLEVYTPDLSSKIGMSDKYRTRLLGFYDFAAVERNDPLPGELTRASLASTGVGVRFGFKPNISLRFDVARILQSVGTRETGDYRVSSALALVF
jgi:hemolysin activation/secretion protein